MPAPNLGLPSVKLSNGRDMPLFGLGTWQSGKDEVRVAVTAALEAGYKAIDGAAGYGNETEVGAALTDCIARGVCTREEVFLTSKLWAASAWPDTAMAAIDKTLADLNVTYIDLFLVHWPYVIAKGSPFPAPEDQRKGYDPEHYLAVWRVLEQAVDAGKIRAIGTSNMSALKLSQLLMGCRIRPAVNQVESHPFCAQTRLIEWCAKRGIVTTAFSPLGSPARPARLVSEGDPTPLFHETVLAIAARLGKSAAQVLIKWQLQRGVVVIPKSVTPARIVDNAKLADFELTADDMAAIGKLDANHRLNKGGSWTLAGQPWQELWDDGVFPEDVA
jgi:alcohol dehydrogenase (NADP+)